jgi:GDP-4-dehydro-6-deoxy-D-mannose reductase
VRDISDVRDVVAGYTIALRKGEPGVAYNLASGVGHTIRELAELVTNAVGLELEIEQHAGRVRADDIPVFVGDASMIDTLGWAVAITSTETVAAMLHSDDYRNSSLKDD